MLKHELKKIITSPCKTIAVAESKIYTPNRGEISNNSQRKKGKSHQVDIDQNGDQNTRILSNPEMKDLCTKTSIHFVSAKSLDIVLQMHIPIIEQTNLDPILKMHHVK